MADVEIRISQTGSPSPGGAPPGGAPPPGAPPSPPPGPRPPPIPPIPASTFLTLERLGTISMATAGSLKMLGAVLKAGKADGELLASGIDAASMALAGLGPYGMMGAAGLQAVKFAAEQLGVSMDDMAAGIRNAIGTLRELWNDPVTQAILDYSPFLLNPKNVKRSGVKLIPGLGDMSPSEAMGRAGAAMGVDYGPGLGNQVMGEGSYAFRATVRKLKPAGGGGSKSRSPYDPDAAAYDAPDSAFRRVAEERAFERQRAAELQAEAVAQDRGRVARVVSEMQAGFDLKNKSLDYEQSGLGQFAASFRNDATLMSEAGSIAASGMQMMGDGIGQLVSQAILGGDLSAKSFAKMAGGMLAATGQMAISQGTYFEILAGVAALGLPIPGLGIVAAGGLAASGAALIGFGIGELVLARAMGAGSGGGRGGKGSGGGGSGGGGGGSPFAQAAPRDQSINVTVVLGAEAMHDEVARVAVDRGNQRGQAARLAVVRN